MRRSHRPPTSSELRDHRELDLGAVAEVRVAIGVAEALTVEVRFPAVS
ncbi:hypothetical protein [Kribbella sancticallisti]